MSQHTQLPIHANCEVPEATAGIMQRVTETVIISQQIFPEQLAKLSEGSAINLPVLEILVKYLFCTSRKKLTTFSYEHCSNTQFR